MDSDFEAIISGLQELGLSEYEARCYVALVRLGTASASEISSVADVHRTRVYDTVRKLSDRGLVEIQHGRPQQHRAIPPDLAEEKFQSLFRSRVSSVFERLVDLGEPPSRPETGVWTISGGDNVIDRNRTLVENAENEAFLWIESPTLFRDDCLDAIADALSRDVHVVFETPSERLAARLREAAPETTRRTPPNGGFDSGENGLRLGRVSLVDRSAAIAASTDAAGENVTGIWASGADNVFVLLVRYLLARTFD